ncbi:site-specific integrase [Amycolatopsis sp. CA-128772]|uniref:site-specific integrase n=1 Tax=Amycolatopsis sp. CA-128772 TaxID=2073159 RepID=UPI0018ED525D|nr:site-specific integrase [Amycolatopsis sp. CA-128772]
MTATLALAAPGADQPDDITAGLWAATTTEFLDLLSWSSDRQTVTFPQAHPLLGWNECAVLGCDQRSSRVDGFCSACNIRWKQHGRPPLERFTAVARVRTRHNTIELCAVPECQRPWSTRGYALCSTHRYQRVYVLDLPLEQFVVHPDVVGLPSFGPCDVVACTRDRVGKGNYCHTHSLRWRTFRRRKDLAEIDEQHWRRTQPAAAIGCEVSLRGLPPRVVAEVLYGLQQRTAEGVKSEHSEFRPLCDHIRSKELSSVDEVDPADLSPGSRALGNAFVVASRRLRLNPETERHKDVWDATVFGARGTLRFTGISQPWLREAAKAWAHEDLPRRRGGGAANTCQNRINCLALLSDSLRLQREDRGEIPAALARVDITNFLNRLAHLQAEDDISAYQRLNAIRNLRKMIGEMRALSLTRPGRPLHGLPDDFTITAEDIPDEPEDSEAGKDLPVEVMRHLCSHLQRLETASCPEIRIAVELLIDTGRRPDEICQLKLECLERDGDGKPVLIYDNIKANRKDRRLPIPGATAAVIEKQQQRVRDRFPDEPAGKLKLLPAPTRNPHGTKCITDSWVSGRHREWVTAFPEVEVPAAVEIDGKVVTKMLPFDKKRIILYAYRHTYAQRHADAGVAVDVLRELMDHRVLETTQSYYRVGEERRREAVERVTTMQFDRHGNRIWREAKALLDSEHARRAVGEVAVPYGACSEPSNVAAGGHDCPIRFRCVGCGHFSTDVSYLPDMQTYLGDLLRNRERLLATVDADEWAKAEAMPSDEEIKRVRRLISRVKADLDDLTAEERAQIEESVAVVRKTRNRVVGLGIPRIRQPLPDVRQERTA